MPSDKTNELLLFAPASPLPKCNPFRTRHNPRNSRRPSLANKFDTLIAHAQQCLRYACTTLKISDNKLGAILPLYLSFPSQQQTAQEYLESSESEEEGGGEGAVDGTDGTAAEEEDAERREEERIQKLWVKRAKRRRVLAEVEQSGVGGDSQGPELLMQEVSCGLFLGGGVERREMEKIV